MEKGLMYGLIGIGIAIVIAVGFVVLALVGPAIKEKRAEQEAVEKENAAISEFQTQLETMEGILQDERQRNSQQQSQLDSLKRGLEALQNEVQDLKAAPPEEKPREVELNIYDLSTLTKENCPDAVDEISDEEAKAKNETDSLEDELEEAEDQKDNLTQQRNNLNTSASNYTTEKNRLDDEIDDLENEIDDIKEQLTEAQDKEDDMRKRKRDIETKCRELGADV